MTIFKDILDEEYLTVSEAKDVLQEVEKERTVDEDRELPYELARTIEHANRFAVLDVEEADELVSDLLDHQKVDEVTAYKIADLLPRDRDELRAVYAQERYTLDGDELDAILNTVAKYA